MEKQRSPKRAGTITGIVVAAVVAIVVSMAVGRSLVFSPSEEEPDGSPMPTATEPSPAASSPAADLISYRDEEAGFTVGYPATWEIVDAADPDVRLLVTPNRRHSMLIRLSSLTFRVDETTLGQVEDLTRRIVTANKGVKLLASPQQVTVAGLPGYFYFYTFKDASGKTGAHSHYFLFDGKRMFTIVFQALPKGQFPRLASTFDRIADSFRLL